MNNGMACWTDWNEVTYRINFVAAPDGGNGDNVMYVNKAIGNLAESFTEIYTANLAPMAVMSDTGSPRQRIAFVGIHDNLSFRSLWESTKR